jgi:cytochrome c554/c'-like protein
MRASRVRARLLRRRLRRAWRTVRPRSRWSVVAFVVAAGVLSVGLFAAVRLGPIVVDTFRFQPVANAAAWRSQTPAFGEVSQCASCHSGQAVKLRGATHAGIGCQSCHGPLGVHALASPGTDAAEVRVDVPTDELCVRCHVSATGRPAGFRQVVPTDHYTATCLACHDPHSGISHRPPIVEHPLDNLPACVTCHGPDGFKARNQRHPDVGADDATCLACHLPGRGPTTSVLPLPAGWRRVQ